MALSENDLDLLEEYLDGQLAAEPAMALRARLSTEPALAAALRAAQEQRALRSSMFVSLEADDRGIDRLVGNLLAATKPVSPVAQSENSRNPGSPSAIVRTLRFIVAAAALILIGFFAGRLHEEPSPGQTITPTPVAEAIHGYQVSITDAAGKVVAVQTFDTLEKATDFTRDLARWQQHQQVLQNGQPVQVADQF